MPSIFSGEANRPRRTSSRLRSSAARSSSLRRYTPLRLDLRHRFAQLVSGGSSAIRSRMLAISCLVKIAPPPAGHPPALLENRTIDGARASHYDAIDLSPLTTCWVELLPRCLQAPL